MGCPPVSRSAQIRISGHQRCLRQLTPLFDEIWTSVVCIGEQSQELLVCDAGLGCWPGGLVAIAGELLVAEVEVLVSFVDALRVWLWSRGSGVVCHLEGRGWRPGVDGGVCGCGR